MIGQFIPTLLHNFAKAVEADRFACNVPEQYFTLMCANRDEINTVLAIIVTWHTDRFSLRLFGHMASMQE